MLLSIENLKISFKNGENISHAVNGISLKIDSGETLGVVGESGSGKSVTSFSILGLLPKESAIIETGSVTFKNFNMLKLSSKELRGIRGDKISMIFQEPMTSLNPFIRIEDQVAEPLIIHRGLSKKEAMPKVINALKEVGITDAKTRCRCFPHELSGGMRQRVMIAMAIITEPELIIADEPTTALDVTTQSQILKLINKLQKDHNSAVMFITHDLAVISNIADRVAVMYSGEIVESAKTTEIFNAPKHPYTKALLEAIPSADKKGERLFSIPAEHESADSINYACKFSPRCSFFKDSCNSKKRSLTEVSAAHFTSCSRIIDNEIRL